MRVLTIFGGGHDSSATFVVDGKVERYLKEERYTGVKHDTSHNAIIDTIINNNLLGNVDYIMPVNQLDRTDAIKLNNILQSFAPEAKIFNPLNEHHLFHASNAFYNSGFEESLVIVIDAAGAEFSKKHLKTYECDSVYLATYPNKFEKLYKGYATDGEFKGRDVKKIFNYCEYQIRDINSGWANIGNLYNSAALAMGQTLQDCGKAMGLSSYGNPIPKINLSGFDALKSITEYFNDNLQFLSVLYGDQDRYHLDITENNYQKYADYCYEVQQECMNQVIDLVRKYTRKTGVKKVCLSGGYAMNIVTNYELTQEFPEIEFFFEPLCNDGGISVGAAMYMYRTVSKDKTIHPIETTSYHGVNHDITSYTGVTVDTKEVVDLLYQNKSVAVFYGQAEAGERALGNRSILFNALNPDARDIVNKIKKREWYRPFAAMVLEEDAHLYFENAIPSRFMTLSFPVKSDIIPGVTHVDGTCRVQTVASGHMYDILREFKNLTGHGILLNTSFNLAGQPLVETAEEALKTLNESTLDYVWFYETKQLFKSTF